MKDERVQAFVNLYAVLGCLSPLCALDEEARRLIEGKEISIGFAVKEGPSATLAFADGACRLREGADECDIRLPFSSCAKFNGLIDGKVTPIPSKGFTKVGFLLRRFTKLTDLLTQYLRPAPEKLLDEAFFDRSTALTFYAICAAIAQIGNEDKVGRASASYIVDGAIKLSIAGGPAAAIEAQGHRLSARFEAPALYLSYMEFGGMRLARDLFEGKVNSVACVGEGKVRVGGMISQVDNVNRILDRVALYLA